MVAPNPDDERLTQSVIGRDQTGHQVETRVVVERPLTLYLNSQEIVTMMTIGDYPEFLATPVNPSKSASTPASSLMP